MSRRSKSKQQKRDWRWWASFVLNGAVALSMVLGTVFLFTGGSVGQQAPYVPPTATVGAPVAAPTATPAVSPTPASSLSGTSAPPAAVGQLNFAVAGDSRGGEAILAKIFDSVSTDGSEFLIHLGDYVNIDSEADWTRFADTLKRFKLPFYPVIGNHDFQRRPTNFFKYTGAKATHYSFDRGPVHFTIVDDSTAGVTSRTPGGARAGRRHQRDAGPDQPPRPPFAGGFPRCNQDAGSGGTAMRPDLRLGRIHPIDPTCPGFLGGFCQPPVSRPEFGPEILCQGQVSRIVGHRLAGPRCPIQDRRVLFPDR